MRKSSENSAVLKLKLLFSLGVLIILTSAVFAQKTEHYNSPLYSPKKYDPSQNNSTSNGIPKALKKVGIEQKLNSQLPLDAKFKDSEGNEVLNGLTGSLKGISFDVGKDYDVVAISFDARENDKPNLTRNKKESYVERYNRPNSADGWHFLTGEQSEIDKVTEAVGFSYSYDEQTNQFAHAGGIMILTPEGKLSRYFYGIDYSPKDVKFGIMESSENKIGNPAEQLYLYCFHYDPSTGRYGLAILNLLRLFAVLTIVGIGAMFFVFWRRSKKIK